ncbi:MAG: hypothetical protein OXH68_13350 [Gammaproteobacteria bacterium]|nr:hypothetical protein [Gammaproteobacteria bacterium]
MINRTASSIRWPAVGLLASYVGILLAALMGVHVEHPVLMALFAIVVAVWHLFYIIRVLRDWYVNRTDSMKDEPV